MLCICCNSWQLDALSASRFETHVLTGISKCCKLMIISFLVLHVMANLDIDLMHVEALFVPFLMSEMNGCM